VAPRRIPSFPVVTRLTHWLTAIALVLMIGSGLQIFNAHPALYAGEVADPARTVFSLPARTGTRPDGAPRYQMTLLGHDVDVPGTPRTAFPPSVTIGGWLAGGRRVHFAAAWLLLLNGLLYLVHTLGSGRWKAVWPDGSDWRALGPTIRAHLRLPPELHTPGGAYNALQRLTYALVALALVPFVVATGLALSPAWDTIFPFLTDLFGGRQGARTWHFIGMLALIAFTLGHVALVVLSGWRTFQRMITGRPLPAEAPDA
jgi:thiosulfate reductase cytochrome b subunit